MPITYIKPNTTNGSYSSVRGRHNVRLIYRHCKGDMCMKQNYETKEVSSRKILFADNTRQALAVMESCHNSHTEDRIFNFYCSNLPTEVGVLDLTRNLGTSKHDQPIDKRCPKNSVMTAMHSTHNSHTEDRVWTFWCSYSSTGKLCTRDCIKTAYVNQFDRYVTIRYFIRLNDLYLWR